MEILERKMIISEVKKFIEWIQQQSGDGRGVSELKDRQIKMIQSEGQREKLLKKFQQNLRVLWDLLVGLPEEERDRNRNKLFEEFITENIANLVKNMYLQLQEAQ